MSIAPNGDLISRRKPGLRRLRWLAIVLPFGFLIAYSYLLRGPAHELFHTTGGFLLILGALGVMVGVFATMIFRLIERQQAIILGQNDELIRLSEHLQGLHAAALAVSAMNGPPSVLQRVVEVSRSLFMARYAALMTADEEGRVTQFITSGISGEVAARLGSPPSTRGLLGFILRGSRPVRVDDMHKHTAFRGFPPHHPPMRQLLGVPLIYQGRTLGSVFLADRETGEPFNAEDEKMLEMFAVQAAIAVESARLYREVQVLATEAERHRIAREMHDGMAQVLAYVNAKAQAINQFLANGQTAEAQQHLDQLAEAVRGVYADVREGILGLQVQLSPDEKLADLLREYVQEYEAQTNLDVRLEVDFEDTSLDSLQEIQVLRILQEALTNVRKHADARHVRIRLTRKSDCFQAWVQDDGRGFDPTRIKRRGRPCFGLQTMQERAESIEGRLSIDSRPGEGTLISLEIPIRAKGKAWLEHEISPGG